MKRQRAVVGLLGFALVGHIGLARADEGDLQELLNENVITTSSKSADTSSSAPGTSTILTAEDIRRYGIHSLDEAIDFLSLGVATANTLRAADIGARGVLIPGDQGNRFLLLIDGHAVNEPLYGAARFDRGAAVPIELIDHIEVILGPGSILYGSNAMLGVINVVTKRSKDFEGVHAVVESEIGKSWRAAAGAGYQVPIAREPLNLTVELEYYKLYGPDFQVGPQGYGNDPVSVAPFRFTREGPPTGIWGGRATESYYAVVPAGQLRVAYENFELTLHASSYKRAAPSNHEFVSPDSDFNDPGNYEIDRSLWADLKHRWSLSSVTQVTSRLYGDFFEYERFMHTSASVDCPYSVRTCQLETYGTSRWVGLEEQGAFDWLKDARLVTIVGADLRARSLAAKSSLRDFDTGAPLASSAGVLQTNDRILGMYVQQTYKPSALLGLNGGVRFDAEHHTGLVASPRIAASTSPWHGATLKGIYSEAFRAPSWHEISYTLPDKQMLAENLQPERVQTGELSLDQKLGMQRLIYGVFASNWTNLIEPHELSPSEVMEAQAQGKLDNHAVNITQFRNVSSIDSVGFNLGLEGVVGVRFHYGLNLTGVRSTREEADGRQLPLVVAPRVFGNARVAYVLPASWPTIALAGRYQARRLIDDAFEPRFVTPPYAPPLFELRATLSGPVPGLGNLSYRASADYAFASGGPYSIGPLNSFTLFSIARPTTAELIPIDRFRTTVGLQYDFH